MAESGADKPTGDFSVKVFLALVGVIVVIVIALAVMFIAQQVSLFFWLGFAAIVVAFVACVRLFRRIREQLREMMAAGKAFVLSLIGLLVLGAIIYAAAKLLL